MKTKRIFLTMLIFIILIWSNIVISANPPEEEFNSNYNIIDLKPSMIKNVVTDSKVDILYPLSSVPIIIEKGSEFTLKFKAGKYDSVYAYISTAYEPVIEEFWLTIEEVWFSDDIWYMKVIVPLIVTEELYNITILLDIDSILVSSTQSRAVSVIEEFTDDFTFVHITDFHVGDPRGFLESIRETIGMKSIKRCIHEINILHPDFVIISGDLVFGQLYWREYSKEYPKCYEMIQMFDVPTYLAPGNHDGYRRPMEDGLDFWTEYFGPHYYSFDYGNYHFLSINSFDMPAISRLSFFVIALNWGGSISEKQLKWIEKDLASNDPDLTFMFLHHNPLWDTKHDSLLGREYKNRNNLLSLINEYGVDMVLAGHVHYDNVSIVDDTIYITTTTPESEISVEDGYWGYRLIDIEDGEIKSYNYKEPKYSIPSYNLKYWHKDKFTAKVDNDLEIDVNALVKFILPKAKYTVDYGSIVLEREDEKSVEIYVEALIEQKSISTITVTLEKAGTLN